MSEKDNYRELRVAEIAKLANATSPIVDNFIQSLVKG